VSYKKVKQWTAFRKYNVLDQSQVYSAVLFKCTILIQSLMVLNKFWFVMDCIHISAILLYYDGNKHKKY